MKQNNEDINSHTNETFMSILDKSPPLVDKKIEEIDWERIRAETDPDKKRVLYEIYSGMI